MTDHDPQQESAELRSADRGLTDYVESTQDAPAPGFADWVMRSVATEPMPRRGLRASLGALLTIPGPYRLAAQATVVLVIVLGGVGSALAIGQIAGILPGPAVGSPPPAPSTELVPSPSPSLAPAPSEVVPTPLPTPVPTPLPTPTPSNSNEPGPNESGTQPTPVPTATQGPS